MSTLFTGFPEPGLEFLHQLKQNNQKSWFDEHRSEYEKYLLEPARLFVMALGERLQSIAPNIQYDPRTDKSIFRIYRDVRFSKDKSPFKTHLGIWFWEGPRKKLENSGFYFHLEDDHLLLGSGIYGFPPDLLERYRQAVDDEKSGEPLVKVVAELEGKPGFFIGDEALKRVPRGYDPDHPRARFLKFKGFGPIITLPVTPLVHTPQLLDECMDIYTQMLPLHQWLVKYVVKP